jgi:hypothetical protein
MSEQFTNGYALLISVNENSVNEWALPDVAKDIIALAKVLTHPERCAYPASNVKVISGKEATRQSILDGLDWLQKCIQADTSGNATAVVYYTGHGWRDMAAQPPAYYLIPYDVRQDNIRSRALRTVDFADAVEALKPQRLLAVLDCCHSGGMDVKDLMPVPAGYTGSAIPAQLLMKGEAFVSATHGAKSLEALGRGSGRAVLSSSQGEQRSYVRRDGKMSIFTYHLIEALIGHAQPQEGAADILVSDVMSYIHRRVPKSAKADWNREQTPDCRVSGNFPIALLLGGKGLSKGQPAPNPLETPTSEDAARMIHRIDTGGGAFIGGSVDTGSGDFVGRDKIVHGDEVHGDKVGGDEISVGDITDSTGIAIGRSAQATVTTSIPVQGIDLEKAEALRSEVAKGKDAEDGRMARLLDGLVELVPGAVSALVSAFASPILAGIAGPVTRFLLERIQAT